MARGAQKFGAAEVNLCVWRTPRRPGSGPRLEGSRKISHRIVGRARSPPFETACEHIEPVLDRLARDGTTALAQIGGVKSGVSGVKNSVNLNAVSCNPVLGEVGKSRCFRLGRWPSGA